MNNINQKQKQIHRQCLKLLNKFIDVCEKHKLNWFIDGGTLLGAVRDGGMIAWDDDIDVVMPRKDYDYLIKNCKYDFNDNTFFLQTPETDNYFEVHAKIRLNNTTSLTQRECTGIHHRGMFLDIFPLDRIKDMKQAQALAGFVKTIGKYSTVKYAGDKLNICILDQAKIFDYMNLILEDIDSQNETSNYIANVVFYRYMDLNVHLPIFATAWYNKYIEFKFKGLKRNVRVPIGYNQILCQWYGADWRTPKHQQSCHNAFVDPNNDYTHYHIETKDDFQKLLKK